MNGRRKYIQPKLRDQGNKHKYLRHRSIIELSQSLLSLNWLYARPFGGIPAHVYCLGEDTVGIFMSIEQHQYCRHVPISDLPAPHLQTLKGSSVAQASPLPSIHPLQGLPATTSD